MTAVVWHVTSLDGFIAAPGDDMRWAFDLGAVVGRLASGKSNGWQSN